MDSCLDPDKRWARALPAVRIFYLLVSLAVVLLGFWQGDIFMAINGLGTVALIPFLYIMRRLLRLQGGRAMEVLIYGFICLSWTLGGAAGVYSLVPGFDKAVHCLSGVLVAMLALAGYRILEPDSRGTYPPVLYLFVFFASMAVAALFELCEFTLAPLLHRDLQHVLDTGVGDTMLDILVCLAGTLVFLFFLFRRSRGKRDPLTTAAETIDIR